jgi:hypothetical protein
MNAESTRSKLPSGYHNASAKPRLNSISTPLFSAFCRARQSCRVGIDPDDAGARVDLFDPQREIPRTAADFKDSVVRVNIRLLDQSPVRLVHTHEFGQRIVKRQQPLMARRR